MKPEKSRKFKLNIRIVLYSIIALAFIGLMFLVDWMFIVGAVIMSALSQRELMKKE